MMTNAVVRARVDGHLKAEAAAVLAVMGLSLSDAIRLMLVQIVAERAIPFAIKTPNAETIAAMQASRQGVDVVRFNSIDDLMTDLNAGD